MKNINYDPAATYNQTGMNPLRVSVYEYTPVNKIVGGQGNERIGISSAGIDISILL